MQLVVVIDAKIIIICLQQIEEQIVIVNYIHKTEHKTKNKKLST